MTDLKKETIGFIGLGVMGSPICRHLAEKSGARVVAMDADDEAVAALAPYGVAALASPAEVAAAAEIVFLSLPGGDELIAVCEGEDGLLAHCREGGLVVDLGTSPVKTTRELARRFAARGVDYADAPVARTRAAAEAGTLSVMVGADEPVFLRLRSPLSCFAAEITHCGGVGAGQVIKLMNNMVLFQTVVALSEALTVARRAGVDGGTLFETLSKGSADSFALRNHGMKAMLPGDFPERAFPTSYALKDLGYALALAEETGVAVRGARVARRLLEESADAGFSDAYFPALVNVVGRDD